MHDAWSAVSTSPISNLFLFFGGKVKLLKRSLHFHLFKKCLFRRELFLFIKTVALMFHSYKSSAFRLWCSVKTSVWAIIDQFKAFHQKHMATSLLQFLYSQPTVGFSTKIIAITLCILPKSLKRVKRAHKLDSVNFLMHFCFSWNLSSIYWAWNACHL